MVPLLFLVAVPPFTFAPFVSQSCADAYEALKSEIDSAAAAEEWFALCSTKYPRSLVFGTPTGPLPEKKTIDMEAEEAENGEENKE